MTASPTPFFAKGANKSDGEHYAKSASCSEAPAPASAAMPSEEEIARAISPYAWDELDRSAHGHQRLGALNSKRLSSEAARRVLALFAPILAEKERMLETSREAGFAMYAKHAEAEARALAAEAALAAARERMTRAGIALDEAAEEIEHWGSYASSYLQEKHDWRGGIERTRSIAAAIRAQGE